MSPWRDGLRSFWRGDERPLVAAPSHGSRGPHSGGCDVTPAQVRAVLADPDRVSMDFQPILDVRFGRTAGWEVLARFDGSCSPAPDVWFAAAYRLGLGVALEALTIRRALSALRVRTPGTFISLNVSPAALDDPDIVDLIAGSAPLTGLVIELTEHVTPPQPGPWTAACHRLRDLGATLAIDDMGKGYAEMLLILELHPQIIKIDKSLVQPVPDDPARRSMLHFLGLFADEIDAWLLAEGVETEAQLAVLEDLGVPLAQGWLVGVPDGVPRPCRSEVTTERPPDDVPAPRHARESVPVSVAMRPPRFGVTWSASALRVPVDLPLVEAARRAMTRPPERRYDAIQCLGPTGDVVGVVAVHDLFLALIDQLVPEVRR